jgi:hypothetical protein
VNEETGYCFKKQTILFWEIRDCIHDDKKTGKCSFWTANEKLKNGENPFI